MWTVKSRFIDSDNICQISILQSGFTVIYAEVIQLWQKDSNFRTFFISLLANSLYEAYFWETPPITSSTCDRPFEFVLVDNLLLNTIHINDI